MYLATILREASRALRRNKLRSALTVLGVTIGIAAVICVIAIGTAGSAQVQEQLMNLGDNLVWIEAGSRAPNGVRTGSHGTKSLTVADAEAIRSQVPLIKTVSPHVDAAVHLVYGNQNWSTTYRGVSPEYFDVRRLRVVLGSPITNEDVNRAANVCVLGETVREQLFGAEDPIKKTIRMGTIPCEVIGILQPKGVSGMGQDQDDLMIIPYTTAQRKLKGINWVDDIMCSAVSTEAIPEAQAQAAELLRERHKIRPGQDDDFNIRSPQDFINARLEASRTFAWLLVCVGSVSLLVGGIGIMNVMLVSVTERTREIGVRLAVGATESHVQFQFLGEAVMLSVFGGLLGVLLGAGSSVLIGRMFDWPMDVPPVAILVAVLFSVAVGTFFGLYPARKASLLDPIEALRFE